MKAWCLGLGLLVVAMSLGCGGTALTTVYDREAAWGAVRTYDWMPQPVASAIGPLAENPQHRTWIMSGVDRVLKERGLRRDEDNPDVLIAYYAGVKTAVDPSSWGYNYGARDRYLGEALDLPEYKGGTIVIDMVDAKTKELSWRGWSSGVVNAPNKTENSIRQAVNKILKQYPPQ